jgi:DNA-directed RNA polymerase specialized sigma24 family protein
MQALILLYYFQEIQQKEIAEIMVMGLALGTVKTC